MTEDWTVNRLAEETALDRRTVKKILSGTAPHDVDGRVEYFKLSDFIAAYKQHLMGEDGKGLDLIAEQARLTKHRANIAAVTESRVKNEVIETETVFRVWENVAVAIRRTILTSGLPQDRIDSILNELRNLKLEDFLEQREFDQGTAAEVS